MMNYTIADYTIESLARGMTSVSCRVKGYWSRDTITLYIQRGFSGAPDWKISVSYGSGGRDTKEVASDTEACRYFAEAMVAMCNLADDLMVRKDRLEEAYQGYIAEIKAETDRINAEKQAKIDADPAIGADRASEIVEQMAATGNGEVRIFDRGTGRSRSLYVSTRGKTIFYFEGDRVSKVRAKELVAQSSARILEIA